MEKLLVADEFGVGKALKVAVLLYPLLRFGDVQALLVVNPTCDVRNRHHLDPHLVCAQSGV